MPSSRAKLPQGRKAVLMLGLVLSLAGCGGGASDPATTALASASATRTQVQGSIFPASEGIVVVEYAADGAELQRSAPTDAAGNFVLTGPLRGDRLAARFDYGPTRVPMDWSARVRQGQDVVQLTTLETLHDQFRTAGLSAVQSIAQIGSIVGSACGEAAGRSSALALLRGTAWRDEARPWLLRSLQAYVAALNAVGFGAQLSDGGWPGKLSERAALLARMCGVGERIYADGWLDEARSAILRAGKVEGAPPVDLAVLAGLREQVMEQTLQALGAELASAAGADPAGPPRSATPGDADKLALALAEASYQLAQADAASRRASDGPLATRLAVSFNGGASVAQSLATKSFASGEVSAGVAVRNRSSDSRQFIVSINSTPIFDRAGLVNAALAMPRLSRGEPLPQVAYRYVMAWSGHQYPLSAGRFQHQPELFVRSLGLGFCDDVSTVLHLLWREFGYDARMWELNGHVVAEYRDVDGWHYYDPDLRVFYFTRDRKVAGVEALAMDPSLITNPQDPILPLSNSLYSPWYAEIFSTTQDNWVNPWYTEPQADPLTNVFTLPGGGLLRIGGDATLVTPTIDAATDSRSLPVTLWVPPGYSGTIELPLVLIDIKGSGQVEILGQVLDLASTDVAEVLKLHYRSGPDVGVPRVRVVNTGSAGLDIVMAGSPMYAVPDRSLAVALKGRDLSGLAFEGTSAARQ